MKKKLSLDQIKKKMLAFRDMYGQDFVDKEEIMKAKTRKQLGKIADRHCEHIDACASDARRHTIRFGSELGLYD